MSSLATMSMMDLNSLSSLEVVTDAHGRPSRDQQGNKIYRDQAQIKTGQYFNFCLADALNKPWQAKIYGGQYSLTSRVAQIYADHKKFFEDHAVLAAGQMLYSSLKGNHSRAELEKRIKANALSEGWKKLGKDKKIAPEYSEICQKLYIEGYRDSVAGMAPYLHNDPAGWAQKYFEFLTSEEQMAIWHTHIASQKFTQVHHQMYEWYVKLLILAPAENYARKFLSIAYAALFNLSMSKSKWNIDMKPFLRAVLLDIQKHPLKFAGPNKEDPKIYKTVINQLIGTFNSVDKLVGDISEALTKWQNANPTTNFAQAGDEVLESLSGLFKEDTEKKSFFESIKTKVGQALKAVFAGAAVGFLIFSIVDSSQGHLDAKSIVAQIGLGGLAVGVLVKGTAQIMALGVGEWLHTQAQRSTGFMSEAAESIATWFEKDSAAVQPSGRLGEALLSTFGKDYTEFLAKRLAPAMAVFGIVMSSWGLAEAIKAGDIKGIVFDSLNTFFSVADTVLMGLEMGSVSWAGGVGAGFAVVGLLVGLIQFIWGLVDGGDKPDDPVADFVNGPLKAAGFAT